MLFYASYYYKLCYFMQVIISYVISYVILCKLFLMRSFQKIAVSFLGKNIFLVFTNDRPRRHKSHQ